MLYRNRVYHAGLGRFVHRDPIEYLAGDANLYRYVWNVPVAGLDPYGLQQAPCPPVGPSVPDISREFGFPPFSRQAEDWGQRFGGRNFTDPLGVGLDRGIGWLQRMGSTPPGAIQEPSWPRTTQFPLSDRWSVGVRTPFNNFGDPFDKRSWQDTFNRSSWERDAALELQYRREFPPSNQRHRPNWWPLR